jgi:hypothetical protein
MTLGSLPITMGQRRQLFGLGRRRGLGIEDLRGLTPKDSISALDRKQASVLIERLGGSAGWCGVGQGTASARQLSLIVHVRTLLGFDEDRFNGWLERTFKVASLAGIRDRDLARRVVGGLVSMQRARVTGA